MRLTGILLDGEAWIAVERGPGQVPISSVADFYADVQRGLALAAKANPSAASSYPPAVPVPPTAKVLCAGLNYVDHAAESNKELPAYPDVFARWASTLVSSGTSVPVPTKEPGLDWEGELAGIVGAELRDATPEEVEASLVGFTCLNDLSARLHQKATRQWAIGKNADRSAPIGPVIVTRDGLSDPYALRLQTRVDGVTMQDGNTASMIFRIGQIGAYASETMTLRPGDVISTGTPQGIGSVRTPPIFLTAGQVVEVEIEGIGVLYTPIGTSAYDGRANKFSPDSVA